MINYNNSIRLLLFILVVVIHMQYDYSVYACVHWCTLHKQQQVYL